MALLVENNGGGPPSLEDLQNWRDTFGLTHPVLDGHETAMDWGVLASPTFFVLDQNLFCRYRGAGYDEAALIEWIEQLLGDPPTPMSGATATPEMASPTPTPPPAASPTPPPASTATEGTSPTPSMFDGVELTISDMDFQQGETFLLSAMADSPGRSTADFYCVLDVFGAYYFYPSWGEVLDFETIMLPAMFDVLGPFTWPAVSGSLQGLQFWAVITAPGTVDLFGEIGHVTFGYSP